MDGMSAHVGAFCHFAFHLIHTSGTGRPSPAKAVFKSSEISVSNLDSTVSSVQVDCFRFSLCEECSFTFYISRPCTLKYLSESKIHMMYLHGIRIRAQLPLY